MIKNFTIVGLFLSFLGLSNLNGQVKTLSVNQANQNAVISANNVLTCSLNQGRKNILNGNFRIPVYTLNSNTNKQPLHTFIFFPQMYLNIKNEIGKYDFNSTVSKTNQSERNAFNPNFFSQNRLILSDNNFSLNKSTKTNIIDTISVLNPLLSIKVSPNPATEFISISFTQATHQQATVLVHNMLGEVVYKNRIEPGTLTVSIPVQIYRNGSYIANLVCGNQRISHKFIVYH